MHSLSFHPPPSPDSPKRGLRQRSRKWLMELLTTLLLSTVFLFIFYWPQLIGPSELWTRFFSIFHPWRWSTLVGLLAVFFLSLWIGVVLHETGHVVVGWSRRMRLMTLSLGPLRIERSSTGWYCRWGGNLAGFDGATVMFPEFSRGYQRIDLAFYILGGPMANLLSAAIGFVCFSWAGDSPPIRAALFVFSCVALFQGVFNLLPIRRHGMDMDGRVLFNLWRRPDVQQIQQQTLQLFSLSHSGIRPRDWPPQLIPAIRETADDALLLQACLIRLSHALDHRDAEAARLCVEPIAARYWNAPDGTRQHIAIGAASYAALVKDPDLLQAWRPLCDGGLLNLSVHRHWLDAEYAAMRGQDDEARRLSAQARAELPTLRLPVDIQCMTETLDALDRRIAEGRAPASSP